MAEDHQAASALEQSEPHDDGAVTPTPESQSVQVSISSVRKMVDETHVQASIQEDTETQDGSETYHEVTSITEGHDSGENQPGSVSSAGTPDDYEIVHVPVPQGIMQETATSTPSVTRPGSRQRTRTDSLSTTATTATNGTRSTARTTRSSMVFVVTALESIAASKDARKRKQLLDSTQRALSAIRSAQGDASLIDPEIMFEPLSLATEATTVTVVTTALDCIGKLISYSYFSAPRPSDAQGEGTGQPVPPLIERAIDTICDCFQGEATPAEVQMQIIKSLLAAILNDKIVVHGAGLLKSVRQTYNIFLLSKSSTNQQIAQGTLSQMVSTVFERVKTRLSSRAVRINSSRSSLGNTVPDVPSDSQGNTPAGDETPTIIDPDVPTEHNPDTKMTLQTFETRKSFDDARITDAAPTTVSRPKRDSRRQPQSTASTPGIPSITVQGEGPDIVREDDEEDEIYMKDAFLVFRAMCKLSTKTLRTEEVLDIKSQGMRSKLLSLHVIHTLLLNHAEIFTSPHATIRSSGNEPSTFTHAIKQYLCLSLSRNGVSNINRVFEVSAEIFWLMLHYLRSQMKRELEVFLKEIYLAILDKRAAPSWQKSYIIQNIFGRLATDPKALVEIYLNYDCDRQALDNIYQRIIEHVSKIGAQPVHVTAAQQQAYLEIAKPNDWREKTAIQPSLATVSITPPLTETELGYPQELAMKFQSIECLVNTLRSMVKWSQSEASDSAQVLNADADSRFSIDEQRESMDFRGEPGSTGVSSELHSSSTDQVVLEDDPAELERVKERKTALNNAIRAFNYKPKRGIKTLIADGFIASDDPTDIARFFHSTDRLNKKSLGEYLGEGDELNIKVMHSFVDLMEFSRTRFVDALRRFLQSFRLPGEAQKIDRLMLKFAERYTNGNPNAFANADTAYVLAYSVILLNTDQHSAQIKKRMTVEEFIKNNRGINDNANLPDEYLTGIYEEIVRHEIILDTERETAANLGQLPQSSGGVMNTLANVGRNLEREAYAQASEEMGHRTEQLFRSLLRSQKKSGPGVVGPEHRDRFMTASSSKHVGSMFRVAWMSFLTALSGAAQETQNLQMIRLCMEGQKLAIRISCHYDLSDPRQAFVASLERNTNLYNLSEMKAKNIEALRALLDIALIEGNMLKESWRNVLTCVSQLDRFQLISSGVEEGAIPDVGRAQAASLNQPSNGGRRSAQLQRRPPLRQQTNSSFQAEIAEESRSADMVRMVDRIFTNTANLSGPAIVDFVKALTQVSWQEIQSSGSSESPRTYSLQKLVEISSYNMLRVRFEWTNIWQVLGQHFIDVGCHSNTHVVFFALNSLRQLSMRFMEIGELPGFKFQKDFLKPFELILSNASQVTVKDMVLRCLIQMIQARGDMIRSGWRTMFGVFTVAAREQYESIVNLAFDNVTQIYTDRFGIVITQGAFSDLVVCLTEFSKNIKFQKKSLQAIETLKSTIPKMLRTPECPLSQKAIGQKDAPSAEGIPKQPTRQTAEEQFWFPVLFAFHDVLMTGEDLEVRSRALNYLFDTLTKYGGGFPRDFWDTLWRQLLYPIFIVLKDKKAITQEAINFEELSVWLSTTLIQALRNMISLFTHFFESLEYMLDRFLDLLALCICQENDTLARIGSNCLQQLILQNVKKFTPEHWEKIVGAFVELFTRTEAKELFSAATSSPYPKDTPNTNGVPDTPKTPALEDLHQGSAVNASNALRINGLPDTSNGVPNVNGSGRPKTPRVNTATSLTASEDFNRSPSPKPGKPAELEDFAATSPQQQAPPVVSSARRRYFNQMIVKCVLQLLMIETVSELFNNDVVYSSIPSHLLLRLMALLKKSYHFAKRFNEDRELRTRLFREGFMKQPPNLLKQESGSASVYVLILLRMYADQSEERAASRPETEAALIPLCSDIIASYVHLDEETQQRNIATWRSVVIDVLEGYNSFPDPDFAKHVQTFAPLAVGLMGRDMGPELQRAVQTLWRRTCEIKLGIEGMAEVMPQFTPTSPRATVFAARRGSRNR